MSKRTKTRGSKAEKAKIKPKRLIIIRHAKRKLGRGREVDTSLTAKGREQAKLIRNLLAPQLASEKAVLLSSPAKRCVETLEPLARKLKRPIDLADFLFEQRPKESSAAFERRVRFFARSWLRSDVSTTVICSHGDWIPVCMSFFLGLGIELKKGGLAELAAENRQVRLQMLLQSVER